jgi:hypothetical protein
MISNFDGLDGFIYCVGVVEDRNDPLFLGRAKVRYFGWHSKSKEEMPTEELPWSFALLPLDNGNNPVGVKEGDWVLSFFQDGILAQEPVMMGRLLGYPEREANHEIGFYDPRESDNEYFLVDPNVPREPETWPRQFDDGSGNEFTNRNKIHPYPDKRFFQEADTHRLARNEKIDETIVKKKKDDVNIGQADVEVAYHGDSGVGTDRESETDLWTEKETPYDAKYPYNHVYASESGHIFEIDDTPNAERIAKYHRVGTFEEIHEEGSRVVKVVESDYNITLAKRFDHIEHSHYHTVDKEYRVMVNKDREGWDYSLTVGETGNLNITCEAGDINLTNTDGNWNISINGDINLYVTGDVNQQIDGNVNSLVKGDTNITTNGNVNQRVDGNYDLSIGGNFHMDVDGSYTKRIAEDSHEWFESDWYRIIDGDKKDHVYLSSYDYIREDYTLDIEGEWRSIVALSTFHNSKSNISFIAEQNIDMAAVSEISQRSANISHRAISSVENSAMVVNIKANASMSIESVANLLISGGVLNQHSTVPLILNTPAIIGPSPDGTVGAGLTVTPASLPSIPATLNNDATPKYEEQVVNTTIEFLSQKAEIFGTMNFDSGNSASGSGFPAFLRNDTPVLPFPIGGILGLDSGLSVSAIASFLGSNAPGTSPGSNSPGTSSNSGDGGAGGGGGGGGGGGSKGPSEPLPDMPQGFLWKPVSESTGKLVVLLPRNIRGGRVTVIKPDNTRVSGNMTIIANGGREHFRFSEPGSAFPPGSRVETSAGNFTIPESGGGTRYEGSK